MASTFDVESPSTSSCTNDLKAAGASGGKSRWYSLSSMMIQMVNRETPDSKNMSRNTSNDASSVVVSDPILSRCMSGICKPDYKVMAAFFVIFMAFIICVSSHAPTMMYPVAGGTVGIISGFIIICWYLYLPAKDRAPHIVLILWRVVCDTAVAIRFLSVTNSNTAHGSSCAVQSFTLEYFEIASELWFLCVALDLLYSVTNPFSTFKERIKKYHYFVWSVSFFFATLLVSVKGAAGTWQITSGSSDNTSNICWLNMNRSEVKHWIPWIFFYLPIIFVYCFSAYVLIYSYSRLRNGISKTLLHRLRILIMNTITVTVSILYWIILGSIYVASFFNDLNPTDIKWLFRIILFMMSAKGYSSFIVWLLFLNLALGNNIANNEEIESFDLNVALRQEVMLYATRGVRISTRLTQKLHAASTGDLISKSKLLFVMDSATAVSEDVPDDSKNLFTFWYFLLLIFGKEEQRQVLQKVSTLSSKSVRFPKRMTSNVSTRPSVSATVNSTSTGSNINFADTFGNSKSDNFEIRQSDVFNNIRVSETSSTVIIDDDDVTGIEMNGANEASKSCVQTIQSWWRYTLKLDTALETVDFTAFGPYQFSRIRKAAGISEDMYINSFKTILKERLTQGGASGSFFFYSEHEYFIGKSCTESEMSVLIDNAEKFANYMCDETNSGTFISKIYGAYRLRIYGVSLYFFVMMNIFLNDESLSINEKYDIKGSWVSRNATPAIHGQQATCTHCGQKFIFSNALKKKFNAVATKDTNKGHFNQLGNISTSFFQKNTLENTGISTVMSRGPKQNPSLLPKTDERSNSAPTDNGEVINDEIDGCFYTVDGYHEPNVILKDNDLKYKILLPIEVARKARRQLRQDAAFLCSIGIMDYSLLVGVHKSQFDLKDDDDDATSAVRQSSASIVSPKVADKVVTSIPFAPPQPESEGVILLAKKRGTLTNTSIMADGKINPAYASKKLYASKVMGPDVYLMGIIDFQQEWTCQKKLERFFKVVIKGEDSPGLSAIEPNQYYNRFVGKIDDILPFR